MKIVIRRPCLHCGFTLVEILIVLIILGILAAIMVPQLSNASVMSPESRLREDLRFLRTQISVFRIQHRDTPPGYPNGDRSVDPAEAAFVAHLTQFTDESCAASETATNTQKLGPYVRQIPVNPLTGKSRVWVVSGPTLPDPDENQPYGWIYNPELQRLIANCIRLDDAGQAYRSY